ncbi:Holliday junction resolvase RecU [Lederbergia citrea]|uniref:Holliday junction resolvase RecU n=1 Tax=Lederbergia citrea TaxID=2833581 RepID=A0A942UK53_9BACI|nr:Holliday junction resolvase RecU [Lederbergia citrea]MBS4176597.1 Holliday junction resolvase RecU [Lederbergia citrea]MBS4222170.1 Holliday junction resolvase RecU [Lederbergia citrea]
MEFNYPNGRKYRVGPPKKDTHNVKNSITYGKRGMTLEEDLNETNLFYLSQGIAVIHKKPTPVQIVQVDYKSRSTAVIKEAYFRQASTTDYNGVFNGKHIDFEAKETQNSTSFPLKNFHEHQINHMKNVLNHGGITFVILRFAKTEEIYLMEGQDLMVYWDRMKGGGRKSITKEEVIACGHRIEYGFHPRIDYLKTIRHLYSL